jgi:serine phosphatase RsbU (regulator of sigma subunit)
MRVVVKESINGVVVADRCFEDEAVYVGSQPGCSVHLPDLYISPHHLLLSPEEDGTWSIEPLDLQKLAKVNGQTLTVRQPVLDEQEVEVGPYVLQIYLDPDKATPAAEEDRLSPTDLAEIKKYPLPPGSLTKRTGEPVEKLLPGQISSLSRAALELGRCRELAGLIDVSLTHLLQGFRGRCAWVGLRRQATGDLEVIGGRYTSGEPCESPELARGLRYRCLERRQIVLVRRAEDAVIGSAVAAPLLTSLGVLGMIYVDARKTTKRLGTSDLNALVVLASVIGQQLETLVREQVVQDVRVNSTELSVVRTIQERLDPRNPPIWKEFQMAAYSLMGQQDSGDVYDVMKVPGKEIGGLFIANVHSQGAMLALLMAQVQSSFRVAMLHGDQPHVFLRQLNYLLYGESEARYVSCFTLMVDPAAGVIRHCRAGRIGAVVVDARGQPRPFGGIGMPAVGVEKGFEYASSEDVLAPGETLALYTGGVTTATNAAGERFREKRFIDALCDNFGQPAAATVNDLKADMTAFFEGGAHPDDMTVLLVHRMPEP